MLGRDLKFGILFHSSTGYWLGLEGVDNFNIPSEWSTLTRRLEHQPDYLLKIRKLPLFHRFSDWCGIQVGRLCHKFHRLV